MLGLLFQLSCYDGHMERAVDTGAERCSIARSLEVLGQKWSLLIVREAMWGRTRFAEFRARLGVAPDVLTDAGRALLPVLAAMSAWGDEYRPSGFGPAALYSDRESGTPLRLAFVDADGVERDTTEVEVVRGPGARSLPESA